MIKDITIEKPVYSDAYKRYVLLVLTGMYAINFVDRQVINILAEPIKKELHISDTQLGLLSGTSFAFLYVVMAIPLSRLADNSNRKNIVAVSLVLWCFFTMMCGLAGSFVVLVMMRVGVGIGEAGGSAPATALISDYFPLKKRATALSIFTSGIYVGIIIGFLMGGWINQYFGWRTAFFIVGFPGIIYAIVLFATVKEPPKGFSEDQNYTRKADINFSKGLKLLFAKKSFLFLSFGTALNAFAAYSIANWLPSFFSRLHHLKSGQIGSLLAFSIGAAGALACFFGGFLSDKLALKNIKWNLWLPAIAVLGCIPFYLFALYNDSLILICISLFISMVGMTIYIGIVIAVAHSLVTPQMRAFQRRFYFSC